MKLIAVALAGVLFSTWAGAAQPRQQRECKKPDSAQPASKSRYARCDQAASQRPGARGVTLFSADWCVHCRNARAFLIENRIEHLVVDIDTPEGAATLAQMRLRRGIPVLIANGRPLIGFSEEAYREHLAGR
jgi:glutaredoxin